MSIPLACKKIQIGHILLTIESCFCKQIVIIRTIYDNKMLLYVIMEKYSILQSIRYIIKWEVENNDLASNLFT